MSNFVCRKCKQKVAPVRGVLSCCGITEKLEYALEENERYERVRAIHASVIAEKVRSLFDPTEAHWNEEDGEFSDYEGIPNS